MSIYLLTIEDNTMTKQAKEKLNSNELDNELCKEFNKGKQDEGKPTEPKVLNINGTNVSDDTILDYISENPKRKNSKAFSRFSKYMKAKTAKEFFKLGGTRGDLRYDEHKAFVKIG